MKPPKQHGKIKFLERKCLKKKNNRKGAKKYLK